MGFTRIIAILVDFLVMNDVSAVQGPKTGQPIAMRSRRRSQPSIVPTASLRMGFTRIIAILVDFLAMNDVSAVQGPKIGQPIAMRCRRAELSCKERPCVSCGM